MSESYTGENVPFKILNIKQTKELNDLNDIVDVYTVYWTIPGLGTFTTNFQQNGFSPETAAAEIQIKANQIGSLHSLVNTGLHPNA